MLLYLEQINEAVDTEDISRIYPYGRYAEESTKWEAVFSQIEKGVKPEDLKDLDDDEFKSIIKLKDGEFIYSKLTVLEIIQSVRGKC